MAAFKALQDACNTFEEDLRTAKSELLSAKVGEPFENGVSKKMRDISLFTSKLRLLRGKTIACTPQVTEQEKGDTIKEYEDTAMWKVLEQSLVKSLTQMHAVKTLITLPDKSLEPGLAARKEKIVASLNQFREEETKLRHLDTVLRDKEQELYAVRLRWSRALGDLRALRGTGEAEEVEEGPLYLKLRKLVDKLEVMRWLTGRLVAARGRYDWLADPRRRISALQLARKHNTIQMFIET